MTMPTNLPNTLSVTRMLLVPVLLVLAYAEMQTLFVAVLLVSYGTDFADGRLARRLGQASILGARLDSAADRLTYLALPACVWWLRPQLFTDEPVAIGILAVSFLLPSVVGIVRFGRFTSYHAQLNRIAAYVVGVCVLCVFAGGPTWALQIAAAIYAVSAIQEIAITLVLPAWTTDVYSVVQAFRLRTGADRARRARGGDEPLPIEPS